ncbi:hypothetical protein [Glycomyces xiaoerkulensis]|uniref:hypothetical protein n=1 Tax=Glycomyces xiaoerkulensis TaxID=2038139 RepID=UPI000C25DEA9|nr:hypothetical protein [Glycomyces xiaoerkulensis]
MGRFDDRARADRLRADYLAAYGDGDPETAYRIGVEELLPLSEALAAEDEDFLDPLATTQRNLSLIGHRLGRRVGPFHYMQRAFEGAMLLDERGLPMHRSLASTASETADLAEEIAGGHVPDPLPDCERAMLGPAASLLPRSIDAMGRLEVFPWAARLRVCASGLRALDPSDLELADHETRSMVWVARVGFEQGNREFAIAEVREALDLWIAELGSGERYWSERLGGTWMAAAQLLDAMELRRCAEVLMRTCEWAALNRGSDPQARALELRECYRAALAALP